MKIFKGQLPDIAIHNAHVTIGTFDGVHIGHQKILNQLSAKAKLNHGESVLFTFDPHPRNVLNPDNPVALLQTIDEKLNKLERRGLQNVVVYPFTLDFAKTPAETFIKSFLVDQLKIKSVVIGYDHHFGKNRSGSLEHFQELSKIYDFNVEEIPAQDIDDINVSSTKIRNALLAGEIETANKYLGEPFQINGHVVHGASLGKKLGFPTANLQVENTFKLIPKNGVYLVRCSIDQKSYFGMMNIGLRPTISKNADAELSIEVHIFDYQKNLYGQLLQVELLSYVRSEIQFSNSEKLSEQLGKDETHCRSIMCKFSLERFTI